MCIQTDVCCSSPELMVCSSSCWNLLLQGTQLQFYVNWPHFIPFKHHLCPFSHVQVPRLGQTGSSNLCPSCKLTAVLIYWLFKENKETPWTLPINHIKNIVFHSADNDDQISYYRYKKKCSQASIKLSKNVKRNWAWTKKKSSFRYKDRRLRAQIQKSKY